MVRVRINRYKTRMAELRTERPTADHATLDEIARDQLGTIIANWQSAQPLTPAEKKLLKAFRQTHQLQLAVENCDLVNKTPEESKDTF